MRSARATVYSHLVASAGTDETNVCDQPARATGARAFEHMHPIMRVKNDVNKEEEDNQVLSLYTYYCDSRSTMY
jgi:hypothetical protein